MEINMHYGQDDELIEHSLPLLQDDEAQKILEELCEKHNISKQAIFKLIAVEKSFSNKEKPRGIYKAIEEALTD